MAFAGDASGVENLVPRGRFLGEEGHGNIADCAERAIRRQARRVRIIGREGRSGDVGVALRIHAIAVMSLDPMAPPR